MRLILASLSPRRKALLESVGIAPIVLPSNASEEVTGDGLAPDRLVRLLARRKIEAASRTHPQDYVLGADTIVHVDGRVLGKPENDADACAMLRSIAGRTHLVYTGIALYEPRNGTVLDDFDVTEVTMRALEEDEIHSYVKTKEPMDKAGSYALQGIGGLFVDRVNGDFSSVIGLPLPKVYRLLRLAGLTLDDILKT